jgi:hypothetical protein
MPTTTGPTVKDWQQMVGSMQPRVINYSILCIFTPTGRTYTFRNVTMICDNETVLQFGYSAMSDGKQKVATFPKNTICGWSVTPNPEAVVIHQSKT